MSDTGRAPRRPAVFSAHGAGVRLDETGPEQGSPEQDVPGQEAVDARRAVALREALGLRTMVRWGGVLTATLGALVSLWAGLAVMRLVEDLFQRAPILGWAALGLGALAGLALLAIVLREIIGLMRLRRMASVRLEAERAHGDLDLRQARSVTRHLKSLYGGRADLAWGISRLKEHEADIFDADDLLRFAERELMAPLDRTAAALVARAARRVSVVTAIAPTALIDMGFVLASNVSLLRALATLYGGRPGLLGLFRLTGMVVTHLTLTGSIALSDGIIQQFLGQGMAARVSARLGEGVINGLFTARIGLAAIEVCRPLPYLSRTPPAMADVMSGVAGFSKQTG